MAAGSDNTPVLSGNAISATTAKWYNTPILMPTGSVVTLDVNFTFKTGGVTTSGYNFFYFPQESNNGNLGRQSSDKILRYRYSATSSYYVVAEVNNKIIEQIELKPADMTMTIFFSDGTSVDAVGTRAWLARTGTDTLHMHLTQNFYVKRLRQVSSGGVLVHDLLPAKSGSDVGMLDVVDNTFYAYNDGNAYIATI